DGLPGHAARRYRARWRPARRPGYRPGPARPAGAGCCAARPPPPPGPATRPAPLSGRDPPRWPPSRTRGPSVAGPPLTAALPSPWVITPPPPVRCPGQTITWSGRDRLTGNGHDHALSLPPNRALKLDGMAEARFGQQINRMRQRRSAPLILELDLTQGMAGGPAADPLKALLWLHQ